MWGLMYRLPADLLPSPAGSRVGERGECPRGGDGQPPAAHRDPRSGGERGRKEDGHGDFWA